MLRSVSLFAAAAAVALSGCATINTVDHAQTASQTFYSGVRLNVAALSHDDEALSVFAKRGAYPPENPGIDLPFSLVADTAMFGLVYGVCMGGLACPHNSFPPPP